MELQNEIRIQRMGITKRIHRNQKQLSLQFVTGVFSNATDADVWVRLEGFIQTMNNVLGKALNHIEM